MPAPDLRDARRVLCVQPHYDDNDIAAGGTLATLADAGAKLAYLTVTDDLVGVLDPALPDEEARRRLRAEQAEAAQAIGVAEHFWLDLPDAGDYDEGALRRRIIEHLRLWRPDFVLTVDPWLPYEAHPDHVRVGRAVAEAALLHGFPRLRTRPEVDGVWQPFELRGVAFAFTRRPNAVFDIGATRGRKHRAIDAYRSQLDDEALRTLHAGLDALERHWARDEAFSHGEALAVVRPAQLHVNLDPRA